MSEKPFRLAVRALVLDEQGRCLLLRRSNVCKHFVGRWEWSGGKVDDGETFDAAVRREVREETGLEIEPTGVVGAYGLEVEAVRVAVLCLATKLVGGALRLSEEHDAHAWVLMADLQRYDLVEGLREMAQAYVAAREPTT